MSGFEIRVVVRMITRRDLFIRCVSFIDICTQSLFTSATACFCKVYFLWKDPWRKLYIPQELFIVSENGIDMGCEYNIIIHSIWPLVWTGRLFEALSSALHAVLSSADFFQNQSFRKIPSALPLGCQIAWILIRPDVRRAWSGSKPFAKVISRRHQQTES